MEGFCRACLVKYNSSELMQYSEKNRRLYIYCTGLQVKQSDVFPFQICQECYSKMKMACQFKKQCRTSDKRLNHFLSLKDEGEELDFCTYLQQNEESMLFKFPLNGNSTPSYQKAKDDIDNVSTSTSIRNFMTDFLREDKIPDTEAHIIREMIEQEADVLEDSLDSQWLQDDISIASDFGFTPFSTPLSKHDLSPSYFIPVKKVPPENGPNFNRRNILADKKLHLNTKSCSSSQTQSPAYPHENLDSDTYVTAKKMLLRPDSISSQSETESVDGENDKSYIARKRILLKSKPQSNSNETEPEQNQGKDMETYLATKSILLNSESYNDIEMDELVAETPYKNIAEKKMYDSVEENNINQDVLIARKGFYVESEENIVHIDDTTNKKGKIDNIDKNLENILNNTNDDVISLSALLASPASEAVRGTLSCNNIIATPSVHQGLSGANTPTIANILFGEKLDDQKSISSNNKVPDYAREDVNSDKSSQADILKDFFDKETGDYIGNVKENEDENFEEFKIPEVIGFKPVKSQFDLSDFSCKKCNKRYKNERGLRVHFAKKHHIRIDSQRKKEQKEEIPCHYCGRIFNLRSNLSKHIKAMHIAPKQSQKCKMCCLVFSSEGRLKMHMKYHGEDKPDIKRKNSKNVVCHICGHVSTSVCNAKTHIARHNKDYSFICDLCDRGFYRKSDIQIHMRYHTNARPFKCSQCPKSFIRKDQLIKHVQRHTGERPYCCEICGSKFISSANLKIHMNTSRACQKEAALKENEAIEEIIDELFESETEVTGKSGNIIQTIRSVNVLSPNHKGEPNTTNQISPKDISVEDLTQHKIREKTLENEDDTDKNSITEMFTIPVLINSGNE